MVKNFKNTLRRGSVMAHSLGRRDYIRMAVGLEKCGQMRSYMVLVHGHLGV